MDITWVAVAASLAMGLGAALLFIFAVKRDWFKDLEDAKYQVFWSDLPTEPPLTTHGEAADGRESQET
jgi:hypothetical protein